MMPETNPAMNLFFCFACRRTLLSCLRDFYCPQSYAFFSDKRNVLKKKFFNLFPAEFSGGHAGGRGRRTGSRFLLFSALSGAYLPDALRFRSRKAFFFFPLPLRYAGKTLPDREKGRSPTGSSSVIEKKGGENFYFSTIYFNFTAK